jgi:hypothetical protein
VTPADDHEPTVDDDPVVVRLDGPTPAGGAFMMLTYLDAQGARAPRSCATNLRIEEYDADGRWLFTTVGSI